MTAPFELQPYYASRRDDYLRLLRDAWGEGAMSGEAFDWWFAGNPHGSLQSVALVDGEVAGVASHSLCRVQLRGERLAQFSVHATTTERARGLGIFRELELRHERQGAERGSAAVLAFASAPTRPLFLGPLGWTQIDRRRVWGRPLPGLLRRPADGVVRPLERFGTAQEEAYRALAPALGHHLVRDARYLNWRYADAPKGYRAFSSPQGFAVLGHTLRRGRRVALVLELVAPRREAAALLRRLAAEARGAAALLAVPSPCAPRRLLASAGFVPTPARLDFMGKELAGPFDAHGPHWTVSLGDTDFF